MSCADEFLEPVLRRVRELPFLATTALADDRYHAVVIPRVFFLKCADAYFMFVADLIDALTGEAKHSASVGK
jgi:hypothetical protein